MAKCSSCGEEILWIRTKTGKNMPVNTQKIWFTEGGKETFVTADGRVVRGTRTAMRSYPGMVGYISHFATCPNADSHRRGRTIDNVRHGGED